MQYNVFDNSTALNSIASYKKNATCMIRYDMTQDAILTCAQKLT